MLKKAKEQMSLDNVSEFQVSTFAKLTLKKRLAKPTNIVRGYLAMHIGWHHLFTIEFKIILLQVLMAKKN